MIAQSQKIRALTLCLSGLVGLLVLLARLWQGAPVETSAVVACGCCLSAYLALTLLAATTRLILKTEYVKRDA